MLKKYLIWASLACIAYFPLFLHLDSTTLSIFDEARRACNAVEMTQNGNLLVTHFEGEPDMWGTKPPFLIWMQAGLMKLVGFNELAVRLPAAMAGLAMVFFLFFFGSRVLKSTTMGVFSLLVLVTTNGFISDHVTRTGDFDALLCLWLTLYLLTFFRFVHAETPSEQKRFLYLTALFVFLAVFTKGIAGFFFLPGLFLFVLISKQLMALLKNKHFWIASTSAIVAISGFYVLREHYNPGYLEAVWNNEVGGRYQNALEGNGKPVWFYIKRIIEKNFSFWLLAVPLGLITAYFGSKKERSLGLLLFINAVVFLLIISNAETKHYWYNAPVFPSLALLSGIGIAAVFKMGYEKVTDFKKWYKLLYIACFCLLIFGIPYYQIIDKVYKPKLAAHPANAYCEYIKKHKDLDHYQVAKLGYNAHTLFYVMARKAEGKDVSIFSPDEQQLKGRQYLLCAPKDKDVFWAKHKLKVLEEEGGCQLLEVVE